MDLLIKGGKVVTATSTFKADVAVTNGKISAIGTNLKPEKKTEVVDAKGKYILPGALDGHTHMAMPFGGTISTDDYFTGTRAAACGGTTTIFNFETQAPGQPMIDLVEEKLELGCSNLMDRSIHPATAALLRSWRFIPRLHQHNQLCMVLRSSIRSLSDSDEDWNGWKIIRNRRRARSIH